jgi:Spy/CpxP family protein refolding chaperone
VTVRLSLLPFALAGTLLGASVAALAQSTGAPAPAASPAPYAAGSHARHHRGGAFATLGLTPDQRAKLKAIRDQYRASQQSGTPETHAQLRAQIDAVLTPEQRAKLQAYRRAHRHGHGLGAPSPAPSPTASS